MSTKKRKKKSNNKTKKNHTTLHDVVIIGAGFSGLYCGYKLKDKFNKILIVEKDNKIGGRILSYKKKINNKTYIFEQGANRFSRYHHPLMLKLINELNCWEVCKFLTNMPHPYSNKDAEYWLKLTNESEFSSKYFSKLRYATLPLHSFTSSIEPMVSTSLFRKDWCAA